MTYNNKTVLTRESFRYETAKPGDFVEETVVDDAMDCMPPACMSSRCSQMGSPYSHRLDPKTGRWRATYATFRRCLDASSVWEYCGYCFQGETEERGREPVFVRKADNASSHTGERTSL